MPREQAQALALPRSVVASCQSGKPETGENPAFQPAQDAATEIFRTAARAGGMPDHRSGIGQACEFGGKLGHAAHHGKHHPAPCYVRARPQGDRLVILRDETLRKVETVYDGAEFATGPRCKVQQVECQTVK